MTAQTMSFRYELACKDHSTEKAQDLVAQQNDLCCFIDLPSILCLKLKFITIIVNYTGSHYDLATVSQSDSNTMY